MDFSIILYLMHLRFHEIFYAMSFYENIFKIRIRGRGGGTLWVRLGQSGHIPTIFVSCDFEPFSCFISGIF